MRKRSHPFNALRNAGNASEPASREYHPNLMSKRATDTPGTDALNWVRTDTKHPETVVLLHAVGYDLTYWDRQIEALRASYNVVAFDLPGHGRSPGEPADWTFEKAVPVIASLIETVSDRPVHLVGISFGGMLAQATVLATPDLVRTLTLIGTASTFTEAARSGMRARASLVRAESMTAIVGSSLDRWFTPEFRSARPDIIDRVTKTILADDPAVHAAIWEMIAGFDVHERLGEIQCPTLVLVGALDPSTPPSAAAALTEAILGAKMVMLPGVSHIATVEAPGAINSELLAFLASHAETKIVTKHLEDPVNHETQAEGRLSLLDPNALKPEQRKLYDQIDQTLVPGP